MRSRIARLAIALSLSTATVASAQVAYESGTVVRIDPQSSVVMLQDGRMYRVTPSTVLMIDNRPIGLTTLRPGDQVVIQSADPVVYREGRYVLAVPGAVVTQAPPPVVAQAPPAPSVVPAPVPLGVRQTIYGVVTDVDRDGKIKVKTQNDSFETRVSPDALRQIKKGDNVVIDMTISPPGAASPR